MALTGLDYFALYKKIDDELPTNITNLIKAINTRNVTKAMVDTLFTLAPMRVIEHAAINPPVAPEEGDTYTIGVGAQAAWIGKDNQIAVFSDSIWNYLEPSDRVAIITIAVPEQEYFFRGNYPAGAWFTTIAGAGAGNLKSDGTIPMDLGYTPTTDLSIATKEYVLASAGIGTVTSVNLITPVLGDVTLESQNIPDDLTGPGGDVQSSLVYLNQEKLFRDGSIPMVPGYVPAADQDIATKKYVDDLPVPFAGKYEYLGSSAFPAAAPVIDDANGEIALYTDANGIDSIFISSYDKGGFPFAFYIEAVTSNREDSVSTGFAEGAAFTLLLSPAGGTAGAYSGMVNKVNRPSYFELVMSDRNSFSVLTPNTSASVHIEADFSVTRSTMVANSAFFDTSTQGAPILKFRQQTLIAEYVSNNNLTTFFLQDPETTFRGEPLELGLTRVIGFQPQDTATAEVRFYNDLIIAQDITLAASVPTNVWIKKIIATGNVTLTAGTNVTIIYEAFEGSLLFAETGPGQLLAKVWDNTAQEVMSAYIKDVNQLKAAIENPGIHTLIVQEVLSISEDISIACEGRKRITGQALYFTGGNRIWDMSGGLEIYCESDIVINSGSTLTYRKSFASYFKTIYGQGNGEGGTGQDSLGGTFVNDASGSNHYERLMDGVQIQNTNSSTLKPWLWSDSTFSRTVGVTDEYQFVQALSSISVTTIMVEKEFTATTEYQPIPLTRNKIIRGAAITFQSGANQMGYDFSNPYIVKFYNDIISAGPAPVNFNTSNAIPDAQVFLRNVYAENGQVFLNGILGLYEWTDTPANIVANATAGTQEFWDNSSRGLGDSIKALLTTSIQMGGALSIAGTDSVTIAAGSGRIVDHFTTPGTTSVVEVSWAEFNLTIPDIALHDFTGVYIDNTGALQVEQATLFTEADRRTKIVIGTALHPSLQIISVTDGGVVATDTVQALMDWATARGGILQGYDPALVNPNLTFQTSGGKFTMPFIARSATPLTPNTVQLPPNDPAPFIGSWRDGGGIDFISDPLATIVNTDLYDDGTGTLANIPNGDFVYRPLYLVSTTNTLILPYAQDITYQTLSGAINAISSTFDSFEVSAALKQGGILLGWFAIEDGATDLSDPTQAEFISNRGVASNATVSVIDTFDELTDTPVTKIANKFIQVNPAGTALIYVDVPSTQPTEGDKGDIIVTNVGLTWTIKPGAVGTDEISDSSVSNAKLAVMTGPTFKGKQSAGTGNPQDLPVSNAQAMLAPPRIGQTTTIPTVTLSVALHDQYVITAQDTNLLIGNPSSTPTQGRKIIYSITDNGVPRNLTFDTDFRAVGVTLPLVTVAGKILYIGAIYDNASGKWDVVAISQEV